MTCRPLLGAALLPLVLLMVEPAPARAQAAAPDGAKLFAAACASCHQADGAGKEGTYPPLAGSEWVLGSESRLLRIILQGITGPLEVQGETFEGLMPAWGPTLKDDEIAAVASYIRASWGNRAPAVGGASVTAARAATIERKTPWTAKELLQIVR